jgi:hypothetical protein
MDGFKLSSRDNLSAKSIYEVSMILPEPISGSNTLSFDAERVWSQPAEDVVGEYRVGFRIVYISPGDACVLAKMIEKF